MKQFKFFISVMLILLLSLTVSNCQQELHSFSFITTSSDFDFKKANTYRKDRESTKAHDLKHWALLVFPVYWNSSFSDSVEQAITAGLKKVDGAVAFSDLKVYTAYWGWGSIPGWVHFLTLGLTLTPFFYYYQTGYVIEGNAVIDPKLYSSAVGKKSKNVVGIMQPDKTLKLSYVSDEQAKTLKASLPLLADGDLRNDTVKKAASIVDEVVAQ